MDMKITFNNFGEIEKLLRFMLQNRFSFSPYCAFCILKQDPEADIVLTAREWSEKRMKIKEDAKPIIVPLPTSKKEHLINGKRVSVYDLSVSDRQKIVENKIDVIETIEYKEYKFFSQNMVRGNVDNILDCEYKDFSNISSEEYLLEQMMIALYTVFKVEVEVNDNFKIGIASFYSKEKKKLFVNDINAKEVLVAWVDMILKETGTQTENITEFERELILFFMSDILPIKCVGTQEIEEKFNRCYRELDFCKSIARSVKIVKYIFTFLNDEPEETEEFEKLIFKNLKKRD